jgi:hypothetical protein
MATYGEQIDHVSLHCGMLKRQIKAERRFKYTRIYLHSINNCKMYSCVPRILSMLQRIVLNVVSEDL